MQKDKLKLVFSMIIFGTIGLVRKNIPCSSGMIAFVRALIGVLFLYIVHRVRKGSFDWFKYKKNAVILCISGVLLGGNWILLFEAYRFTSISVATICYYMAPVFVMLVSPLLFKEQISTRKKICAVVAVIGMIMVSGVFETGIFGGYGIACGLGAAMMYAGVMILNKMIRDIPGNERTILQLGISAVAVGLYEMFTNDISIGHMDLSTWGLLIVAGIVHTGIAYWLYFGSIQKLPAQTVALFSYIDPVTAILISVLLLGESVSIGTGIGVALVLGSALLSET